MWLLDTTTYTLHLEQDPARVTYAILSHVWDQDGEQTFQDIQAIHVAARQSLPGVTDDDPQLLALVRERLSPKVRSCCDYARSQGFKYAWIDTCCIDKSSSAELSEAITSMFDWYSLAAVCYVFLADVPETEDPAARWSQFRRSMWFERGWTLQELIVPQRNVFLSKNWRPIGTKKSLSKTIETITGIDEDILVHRRPLHTVSVARRMSWAQFRQTTRVEDEAYSLMGIFGVHIPAIYGEGRYAFVRLQEEIMKCIPDQSLFAWGDVLPFDPGSSTQWGSSHLRQVPTDELRASKAAYLFASCPVDFGGESNLLEPLSLHALAAILGISFPGIPAHSSTGYGVRITMPIYTHTIPQSHGGSGQISMKLAILACRSNDGCLAALILSTQDATSNMYFVGGLNQAAEYYEDDRTGDDWSHYVCAIPNSGSTRAYRTLRFSQSSPRMIFREQSSVAHNIAHHLASLTYQEICIPYQRLEAGFCTAMLKYPSFAGTKGPRMYLTCPCTVTLPPWTLAHLQELGFVVDVEMQPSGEMHPASVPGSLIEGTAGPRQFVLQDGTAMVVIALFPCPALESVTEPLEAAVSWRRKNTQHPEVATSIQQDGSEVPIHEMPTRCDGDHVDEWPSYQMCYKSPAADLPTVHLQFSVWDYGGSSPSDWHDVDFMHMSSARCYVLDVRLEYPGNRPCRHVEPEV